METGKLLLSKFTLDIVIQICTNGASNGCVYFLSKILSGRNNIKARCRPQSHI